MLKARQNVIWELHGVNLCLDFALLKPLTYNPSEVQTSTLLKDLPNNVRICGYSMDQKLKSLAHE